MKIDSAPGKEVVWVFGSSGAGKETFITHVVDEQPEDLVADLGWRDKAIAAEPNSMLFVGKIALHDERTRQRRRIIPSVLGLLSASEVVLVKGQQVDVENRRPQRLMKMAPSAHHRIIYLDPGIEEHVERMKRKPWWSDEVSHGDVTQMRYSLLRTLENLRIFPIQTLDSSRPLSYPFAGSRNQDS